MKKVLLVVGLLLFAANCGGGAEEGGGGATVSGLAAAFPADLAVTSPFAAGEASLSINKALFKQDEMGGFGEDTGTIKPFRERKEEIGAMLVGSKEDDCSFSLDLFKQSYSANCYGPTIYYENHPGCADEIPGSPNYEQKCPNGRLPGGDTGIWAEYNFAPNPENPETAEDTGEACAAAQLNSSVSDIAFKVDTAINMFAGMFCMAKVEGEDQLPAVGSSKDLKAAFEKVATGIGITISGAVIERLSNDSAGNAVYHSHIEATVTAGDKSATLDVHLKHIPLNEDNTEYNGKLWYTMTSDDGWLPGATPNCRMNNEGGFNPDAPDAGVKQIAASILYSKDTEGQLKYHFRNASYCNTTTEPFDDKNNVDPTKYAPSNGEIPEEDGWAGNFNMGTFDIDTTNGTGSYALAWQAGTGDRNTRTFLANLTETNGNVSGCAYFGYGPDIKDSTDGSVSIDRFICNWAGPGSEPPGQRTKLERVQQQCMVRDNTTGIFTSTTADLKIRYAPTLSCDVDTGEENFIFYADFKEDIPLGITTNDKTDNAITWASDLLALDLMDVTPPTPPTDIE